MAISYSAMYHKLINSPKIIICIINILIEAMLLLMQAHYSYTVTVVIARLKILKKRVFYIFL